MELANYGRNGDEMVCPSNTVGGCSYFGGGDVVMMTADASTPRAGKVHPFHELDWRKESYPYAVAVDDHRVYFQNNSALVLLLLGIRTVHACRPFPDIGCGVMTFFAETAQGRFLIAGYYDTLPKTAED